MKKSTFAAIAAASVMAFGVAGNAYAELSVSGFADVNYDAMNSEGEEGNFRASGEIDFIQEGDGATVRLDLDLLNAGNASAPVDLPTGTDALNGLPGGPAPTGVDIEQLYVSLPLTDMISLDAGIVNSFHGMEGQDAPDSPFAYNGLLWLFTPDNVGGGIATIKASDQLTAKVGFINNRSDMTTALVDNTNDYMLGVTFTNDMLTANVSYLSDNSDWGTPGADGQAGAQIDVNVTANLVEGLSVSAEYLSGDPLANSEFISDGYGLHATYSLGDIKVHGRYEMATTDGTSITTGAPVAGDADLTMGSVAVAYAMSDDCTVSVDFTDAMAEDAAGGKNTFQMATVQIIHSF